MVTFFCSRPTTKTEVMLTLIVMIISFATALIMTMNMFVDWLKEWRAKRRQ